MAVTSSSKTSATSSVLSSSTPCPPITWTNSSGTATVSYEPVVQRIVQDASFTALTHGLCYSFSLTDIGETLNTAQWERFTNFVFDHFNGTIIYPCGVSPAKLRVSEIIVSTVLNGTALEKISSMNLNNDTASLNEYMACPWFPGPPPAVWVKSVMLVPPYTPTGPTIEVTLTNAVEQMPIIDLTAVLSLAGETQAFAFIGVSASTPLLAGQSSSETKTVVVPVAVNTTSTYPMTIAGTFQNGTKLFESVQVEVQLVPPAGSLPLEPRVNLNPTLH